MPRKRRCELGSGCPYIDEYQHAQEFYHTDGARGRREAGRTAARGRSSTWQGRGRRLVSSGSGRTGQRGVRGQALRRRAGAEEGARQAWRLQEPIVVVDTSPINLADDSDSVESVVVNTVTTDRTTGDEEADLAKALALSRAEAERTITLEQDAAYEESLATDRLKHSKREREEAERREAEELQQAIEESKVEADRAKRHRRNFFELQPQPATGYRVKIRLPDGTSLERRFEASTTLLHVRDFVSAMAPNAPNNFDLVDVATRRRLLPNQRLEDIGPALALLVVDLEA